MALAFKNWLSDTFVPDESFYSTLVRVYVLEDGSIIQALHVKKTVKVIKNYEDKFCRTSHLEI